jgi:CheY-like chemotaxis protein
VLPSTYINLEKARALIIDDNAQALDIIATVLSSFGLRDIVRASGGAEALEILKRASFDLILTDANMPEMDGYEFIHKLRRTGQDSNRVTPVIVVTGHTRRSQVFKARDCGANLMVAKPITPTILLERIFWVAKGDRMFVETDDYVGPDRRFKQEGPPAEFPDGRRRDDVSLDLGVAETPNLSQDELNSMVKPQRIAQ